MNEVKRNCTNIYCMLATDFRPVRYSWEGGNGTIFLNIYFFKQGLEEKKIKGLGDVWKEEQNQAQQICL